MAAGKRYSQLAPLSIEEQKNIAVYMCEFFSPIKNEYYRKTLELPIEDGKIVPLHVMNFLSYMKKIGFDLYPKMSRVEELALSLERKGILKNINSVDMNKYYYFMKEITTIQKKGLLWLGEALGPAFIGHEIEKDICYITGKTDDGDQAVGTGLLINNNVILTCAHVVDDMTVDDEVLVGGVKYPVKNCLSHESIDVGLIFLNKDAERKILDISFRNSRMLEEVVVAGFPPIPRSTSPSFTLQRGEICGHISETMDKYPLDLFSAIARPGNSGGPVIGLDGGIVGIVTRSLERNKEMADQMSPLPFFASVPSSVIANTVTEITNGEVTLPWENYE